MDKKQQYTSKLNRARFELAAEFARRFNSTDAPQFTIELDDRLYGHPSKQGLSMYPTGRPRSN